MKLLIIINTLTTGGAEKLLLETIPKYRNKGLEVDLLVFWDNDFPFLEELKALNCCKIHILNKSDRLKDVYAFSNIWKLRRYMKSYDIVHAHLFPSFYYAVFAKILAFAKCRLVCTEHSTTNSRMQRAYFKPIEKLVYRSYYKIIVISPKVNKVLTKYIPDMSEKFVRIDNGVNISAIQLADKHDKSSVSSAISEINKVILQVSAFREGKDQATLIRAMTLLPDDIILWLAGDGPTRERHELMVKELNLSHRVFFLGNRSDIPQLLNTADIITLASHYEGLSLASIEGMASGKPFISSNVPGLSDIVEGAGLLFEDANEEGLAGHIEALLNDELYYNKIAQSCKLRASMYDINEMVHKHINLYNSIA